MKVADFFAFDVNRYQISECLKDITKFEEMFAQKLIIVKNCKFSQKPQTQMNKKSSDRRTVNEVCRRFTIKLTRLSEKSEY